MSKEPSSRTLLVQSMRLAGGLAVLKTVVGFATGSMGVLASALDSLLDLSASAVNYVSHEVSHTPPDKQHPYGHGKIEGLAGLFQGAFIAVSGGALLWESLRRWMEGASMTASPWAMGVMGVSVVASVYHSRRLRHAHQHEGSTILRTETAHFAMDVLTNTAILGALVVVRWTGHAEWDLLMCAVVTGWILFQAGKIFVDCSQELMDRGLPRETLTDIEKAITSHDPSIVGLHNLRARKAGGQVFVDFHVELRGVNDFRKAHGIVESLIDKVKSRVPGADVTVHYDPEGER